MGKKRVQVDDAGEGAERRIDRARLMDSSSCAQQGQWISHRPVSTSVQP